MRYNQNFKRNRFSIRFGNSQRRSKFNNPRRSFSQNPGRGPGRSKLEGADKNLFIKKATFQPTLSENSVNHTFENFNLNQILKQNIQIHGFTKTTPIQSQAITPILEGRDVIGLASTGTGKTAAFLIPLIDKIFKNRNTKVLIIAPTRELAVQINQELRSFTQNMRIFSALIIGGSNMYRQIYDLKRNPNFVIATPGRLKDLIGQKAIYLQDYSNIVLDEVDLMVDIGFINDIKFFISLMPIVRQSLFFSATIPPKVQSILQSFITNPVTISIKKQDTSENVDQDIVRVINPAKKLDQLHDLLIKDGFDKVLIFGRTKHGIDKLDKELTFRGFKTGSLHGNKRQSQRRRVLESFKRDEIQILLATDVASRGLDIENVTHVINYDLPLTFDDYIHRIGRTGRADKKGVALTFIS